MIYSLIPDGELRRFTEDEIRKQLDLLKEYNPEEDNYEYYSIVTNIDSLEMTGEQVIEFYRGRANCENFIKEQKHNFDFLHFPCKKFEANQAWGLILRVQILRRLQDFYTHLF